ncbi:hypothetical protein ACFWZT_26790 [Streptomyces alboflavus]|uniref:hypothetical protein n=1 Tax=Streptomyces alboflavus TaxID=67267 RepID=UPI00369429F5
MPSEAPSDESVSTDRADEPVSTDKAETAAEAEKAETAAEVEKADKAAKAAQAISTDKAPPAAEADEPEVPATHPATVVVPPAPESPDAPAAPAPAAAPVPPAAPPRPAATPAPAAPPHTPPPTPPPPTPLTPPPLAPPAGPATPSPVGAFIGRAVRGDWAGAAQAALWPLALLLITAAGLAIPTYGQESDDIVVGFGDRMRLSLAAALQAVGGDVTLSGREERGYDGSSSYQSSESAIDGTLSVHLVPLTVTALFVLALLIGVRILHNRLRQRAAAYGTGGPGTTAGLEAAVRVGVLTALGVLVLGLFAQPEIRDVEVSSGPFLAMLGALGLALVVSAAVLHRDDLTHWLAVRPGAQSFVRAAGVTLRALAIVLVLASAVGYFAFTQIPDLDDASDARDSGVSPYLVALLVLPNLGIAALGVGWGAPLEAEADGRRSAYGDNSESHSFALSELGDLFNSGAVVGAVALGLVCALTIGVLAARRCAGRGEQILAGGLFFGLYLLLAAIGGFSVETSAKEVGYGGDSATAGLEGGVSLPDVLLFGLLWVAGALVVGPLLVRMAGQGGGVGGPPGPPGGPGGPGGPGPVPDPHAAPTQSGFPVQGPPAPGTPPHGTPPHGPTPYDPHAFQIGHPGAPRPGSGGSRGRTGVWVATLVGALVLGGGTAAGLLLWQDDDGKDDAKGKNERPAVSRTEDETVPPPNSEEPTGDPSTPDPTTDTGGTAGTTAGSTGGSSAGSTGGGSDDSTDDAPVPAGSARVNDVKGFSFAVPDGWSRERGDNPTQVTYAGLTGPENFQIGVIDSADYTSYGNMKNMEVHAKKDPDKSDYRRLRLAHTTFQGHEAAVWEYTYTDRADRTIHAINHSYIADNGTEYALQLSWREDFWPAGHGAKTHQTALDTWHLTG